MTQQYIVGEFSSLLGELSSTPEPSLHDAAVALRHRVEVSPPPLLPRLAHEALDLTDTICVAALEQGDVSRFARYAGAAAALADLTSGAGLLP